jgi:hypothetical protein
MGAYGVHLVSSLDESSVIQMWQGSISEADLLFPVSGFVLRIKIQQALTDLAIRIIASTLRSTSRSVVAQQGTEIRIAACPCHCVPPHQQVPSA